MKIVVIGGTGLIGSKLVANLREQGHEAVAAAPSTGVNTLTGEGLKEVLEGASVNGIVEVAGPERFRLDELIRQALGARHDPRDVVSDPHARYFGAELGERTLIAGDEARLGDIRFEAWLGQTTAQNSLKSGAAVAAH